MGLNGQSQATDSIRQGRPGRGVAVLLKIYAHCIDGQADAANQRITETLCIQDKQPESQSDNEGDDESELASRNARSEARSRGGRSV
jgi:hypothetical protein